MADPRQLCYLCERPIEQVGRSDDEWRPGVCFDCDQKENPKKQADRNIQRQAQGLPPEGSSNPLLRKPGMPRPAKSPLQKHFENNPNIPQAPFTPPPEPKLPPEEDGEGNPLNR